MLRSSLIFSLGCLVGCSNDFVVNVAVVGDVQNIQATGPTQSPHTINLTVGRLGIDRAEFEDANGISEGVLTEITGEVVFDFVAAQSQTLGTGTLRRQHKADVVSIFFTEPTLELVGTVTLSDASEVAFTALLEDGSFFSESNVDERQLGLTIQLNLATLLSGIDYDLLAAGNNEVQILPGSNEEIILRQNLSNALSLVPNP